MAWSLRSLTGPGRALAHSLRLGEAIDNVFGIHTFLAGLNAHRDCTPAA